MWKKVPRQTTKRGRNSFWRRIEPVEKMADGVTSSTFAILGSIHPAERRGGYESSTTVHFIISALAETSGKRSSRTTAIIKYR
jgi:hypothetical protein